MKIKSLTQFLPTIIILILANKTFAQLGINSDNSAPSTNAMLDVKSATKGILIPRVGADLASPTEGLLYYNTANHNFRYYDGTAWQAALFGNQWNINGTSISYSGGNVGIGITNPARQFVINGTVNAFQLFQQGAFTGTGIADGLLVGIDNNVDGYLWNYEFAGLRFGTNNIERLTILSNGNIGIGDNTPNEKLDVTGNINLTGEMRRTSTGAANMIPIAYGTLQDNGNILNNSNNWTLTHVDNSGIWDIAVTGEAVALTGYVLMATPNANFPTFVVSQPISGKMQVKTYTSAGTLQDIGFSFVIYKP